MWRKRRKYVWAAALVLGVAVLGAAWMVARAEQSLTRVETDAELVSAAVASGDAASVHASFLALRQDAASSEQRTAGPAWWVLARVPWIGDDARAVRAMSEVASQLSTGPVEQLALRSDDLNRVMPSGGRVDLAAVRALSPVVAPSLREVDAARARLAAQDPAGLITPLRHAYDRIRTRVDALSGALRAATVATSVLPEMLAGHGPAKHYILVLQNNAEIRSTGGLPGAVSEIVTHHGTLSITNQTSGGAFPKTTTPVLPLTPAEQALYGDRLGEWFVDANFTPDFPRTAELMRAHWQQAGGGPVDGVVSVDPVALSYLLGATGPVTVDGVTLTSDNVVDQLLHDAYVRLAPADQDAFFRHVTKAIFDLLVQGGPQPAQVAKALARGVAEHRVLLHDFTPSVQRRVASTGLAGELVRSSPSHPQVGVYLNDATGAKMSYYLRYQTQITPLACHDGGQRLGAEVTIGSQAPASAASMPLSVTGGGMNGVAPGNQVVAMRIYGPFGGAIHSLTLDGGAAVPQEAFDLDGRPVTTLWVSLPPGRTHTVRWSMTTGSGQTGSTDFAMTPSAVPGRSSGVVASACG